MLNNDFLWLLDWFYYNCNGNWEHLGGIRIFSVDKEEWSINIDLSDSKFADLQMNDVYLERSQSDWVRCFYKENRFKAQCSFGNLFEVLHIFREWIETRQVQSPIEAIHSTKEDDFSWIIDWFQRLDRSRTKEYRLIIETLDNPGWTIWISLEGTALENKIFRNTYIDRTEDDWLHCKVEQSIFNAACGPTNFLEALNIFREWEESFESDFEWILKWYADQCNEDWEHEYGIKILTIDNPGWYLTIDLAGTQCEGRDFSEILVEHNDREWFFCLVRDGTFEASSGIANFGEVLKIFRNWAENCAKEAKLALKVPREELDDRRFWQRVLRYDGCGTSHMNRLTKKLVATPHMHDLEAPGKIRLPYDYEIPKNSDETV